MWGFATAVLVLAAALASGCADSGRSATTSSPAPTASTPAPSSDLCSDAAALAARGDHAGAERTYREALKQQPDDFDLHYGLAAVLSHLEKRAEAIEAFRWVVANGTPGRAEVGTARRWLAEAAATPGAASTRSATRGVRPAPIRGEPGATGTITGTVTWPGLPEAKQFAIRVIVDRDGGTRGRRIVRAILNRTYTIDDLAPGNYMLMAAAGTVQMWKHVPVTVHTGRETVLDLSPTNAAITPAEFAGL